MKLGFNEATALECKGQSLMAALEMWEKYGFDYIEIRFDCVKDYLKEHTLEELADCKPIYEEFEGFSEDDAKAAYAEANTAKPGLFPDTE